MNKQETFDKVVNHLLTQNRKAMSIDGAQCRYFAENGDMCAVGCLIKEEHYFPGLEGYAVNKKIVSGVLLLSGIDINEDGILYMLEELQGIHDRRPAVEWAEHLRDLAVQLELQFNYCGEIK